jgi:hypothetical protein
LEVGATFIGEGTHEFDDIPLTLKCVRKKFAELMAVKVLILLIYRTETLMLMNFGRKLIVMDNKDYHKKNHN